MKEIIKREVGDLLVEEINRFLDKSKSPVSGGRYKTLKKDGKKSILLKEGDMRASIAYEEYRDGVEVGIFDPDQVPKADNHNKNSAASKKTLVPPREFIPKKDQKFKRDIKKKMDEKIQEVIRNTGGN